MFDLGDSLVQGDSSNGTYYLIMATLQVRESSEVYGIPALATPLASCIF